MVNSKIGLPTVFLSNQSVKVNKDRAISNPQLFCSSADSNPWVFLRHPQITHMSLKEKKIE